jgi:nucleoside-diphosphate-sugar epimerase
MKAFLTGGTGLLGSHIAAHLVRRGDEVVAFVRPASDTRFLASIGVSLAVISPGDREAMSQAMRGCDVLFHAAARVSDWGTWEEFRTETIETTGHVLEAMVAASVPRLVHISTVGVYGHRSHWGGVWTENDPCATRLMPFEYYPKAKIATEKLVSDYHKAGKVAAVIIRPGWIYGPRDRASLPRLAGMLKSGLVRIVGSGDNRLHLAYAGNVADCCILAAESDAAAGRIYNASNDCQVTQREYIDRVAEALGFKPVTASIPIPVAMAAATLVEFTARMVRSKSPPPLTRPRIYLIANNAVYESRRAREELGWRPAVGFDEGLKRTVDWFTSASAGR